MNELNDSLPSMTALLSAAARAAHELVDSPPHVLLDLEARALCDLFRPSPLAYQLKFPYEPVLAAARVATVVRSSFARRVLTEGDCGQCVLLGAGLDTSVYQGTGVKVWRVDRPAVLAWRAKLFAQAELPDSGVGVAADLGAGLAAALASAGLDLARPTLVVGLGLSMYLSGAQARALLAELAHLGAGSELVFDSILPDALADDSGRDYAAAVAAAAGRWGEPWRLRPSPEQIVAALASSGWEVVGAVAADEAVPDGFWTANPKLQPMRLTQLVHARQRLGGRLNSDELVG